MCVGQTERARFESLLCYQDFFLVNNELPSQFVMRLFYVEQAVPQAVVQSWINQASYGDKAKEASKALSELGIWQDTSMPGGLPAWILDKTFRTNLKVVLVGG